MMSASVTTAEIDRAFALLAMIADPTAAKAALEELKAAQAGLDEKAAAISARETEVDQKEQALAKAGENLQATQEKLTAELETVGRLRVENANAAAINKAAQVKLATQQQEIREAEARLREGDVRQTEQQLRLDALARQLKAREDDVVAAEKALAKRAAAVQAAALA